MPQQVQRDIDGWNLEMVRELDKVDDIDRSYYDKLVNEAVDTILNMVDFEMFVSG